MKNYWNKYQLLNATAGHPQDADENTFLYTLQYALKNPDDFSTIGSMEQWLEDMFHGGFFNQVVLNSRTHFMDLFLSKDQALSYSCYSYKFNTDDRFLLWNEIKFCYYNNVDKSFWNAVKNHLMINPMKWTKESFRATFRFFHPQVVVMIGLLCESKRAKFFQPVLWLCALWTFGIVRYKGTKIKTDGQLLMWCFFQVYTGTKLEKVCNYLVKKNFGCWELIFLEYFERDHPNNHSEYEL